MSEQKEHLKKQKEFKPDKVIRLEGLDTLDFLGVNNVKFSKIVGFFPKLKLIARNDEIKVFGAKEDVNHFTNRFNFLIDYYNKYNSLSLEAIDELLSENGSGAPLLSDDVIVLGHRGEAIRAKTANQKLLFKSLKDTTFQRNN